MKSNHLQLLKLPVCIYDVDIRELTVRKNYLIYNRLLNEYQQF